MKRNIVKAAILCLVAFAYQTATAQSDLGSILNNVLGGNSSSDNVISGLTSIFSSKKQASEKNIVGTWTYEEPAIVLKSENVLTNAAAKVAASSLEKKTPDTTGKGRAEERRNDTYLQKRRHFYRNLRQEEI